MEKGWDDFTFENNLVEGQLVEFVYRNEYTFEVYVKG